MSDGNGSKEPSKSRLCERCGKRMPPQKRGRPRRWCSQQCRQSAYEERHGLESWKDKQPKVENLSEFIEAAQERAARQRAGRRYVTGIPALDRHRQNHRYADCLGVVCSDEMYMRVVLDRVTDMLFEGWIPDTIDGRFLAGGIARLVNTVAPGAIRVPDPTGPEGGRSSSPLSREGASRVRDDPGPR